MALDYRLREIVSQAAGLYFLVTDHSQVQEIEDETKLRVMFINEPRGLVNCLVQFSKGDTDGFESVFGTSNRITEKKGNFGIKVCKDALASGPIGVINLRPFPSANSYNTDICSFATSYYQRGTVSSNITTPTQINYPELFDRNGFWNAKPKLITEGFNNDSDIDITSDTCYLNFGNIGSSNVSLFVVKANETEAETLTREYEKTLGETELEIEDCAAINWNMKLKDTFVTVYVFANDFTTLGTDYAQLFVTVADENKIKVENLNTLAAITTSGFIKKFSGSLIPGLKNEYNEEISIDTVMNMYYSTTNIMCDLNVDLLDIEGNSPIDLSGAMIYKYDTGNNSGFVNVCGAELSYYTKWDNPNIVNPLGAQFSKVSGSTTDLNSSTMRVDDVTIGDLIFVKDDSTSNLAIPYEIIGKSNDVPLSNSYSEITTPLAPYETLKLHSDTSNIESVGDVITITYNDSNNITQTITKTITAIDSNHNTVTLDSAYKAPNVASLTAFTASSSFYSARVTVDRGLPTVTYACYCDNYLDDSEILVQPTTMKAYVSTADQFINGTSTRQKEILDLIYTKGMIRGLKNVKNLRYFVDTFKSYVEPNYKEQYGNLVLELDKVNKYVSCILNEPFVSDLIKSTNPLFRDTPDDSIMNYSYIPKGGNPQFTTVKLEKFTDGVGMCFFFGPGDVIKYMSKPLSGIISNLFVTKKNEFDIIANTTGYLTGVTELEEKFSDEDRKYLESFRYNPIIDFDGITIFGNLTGQKTVSKQQQIHNAELLQYIKTELYKLCKNQIFTKGAYDEYLRCQTQVTDFMDNLALRGAIEAGATAQCNLENNTEEIRNYKIKLIKVDYTPFNCTEKVVFDLNIW